MEGNSNSRDSHQLEAHRSSSSESPSRSTSQDDLALNIHSAPLRVFRPAGFWRRFLASMIDGMFISVVVFPVTLIVNFAGMFILRPAGEEALWVTVALGVFNMVFQLVITMVYAGWFLSRKGATPGKMALKLRVYNSETSVNVSFWSGAWRETIGKLLSGLTLGIGFIMAGVRGDKRALHDLLFDTRVVYMEN
ncbi:MAG TPA: RDD family protein [Pseudobdellovibrionaceae bacterium]|nr:RDD family protein [Pseudobdellovibrionaceae bacterium]